MAIQVQLLLVGIEYVFAFQICYYELCVKKNNEGEQTCELTCIERVSPAFRDSHPHENLSFTSTALPMFYPLYRCFTRIL